jgi:exosortase
LVALFAVVATFYLLGQAVGKKGLLHFAFPVLFIFSSVPWPVSFENMILQNLMQINAEITAFVLSLGTMEAVAHGNVIEVAGQLIGVEEACSGIRSLQTSFMMSLFLGEFYRIQPKSRVWLVLLSFLLSFLFNSSRTIVLTYVGASEGLLALESWHDPLGYGVLIITLTGLWGTAYWFFLNGKVHQMGTQKIGSWMAQVQCGKQVTSTFTFFLLVVLIGELTS